MAFGLTLPQLLRDFLVLNLAHGSLANLANCPARHDTALLKDVAEARVTAMRGAAGILLSLEEDTLPLVCEVVKQLGVLAGDPAHSLVVIECMSFLLGHSAGHQRRWLKAMNAGDKDAAMAFMLQVRSIIIAVRLDLCDLSAEMDTEWIPGSPTSTMSFASPPGTPHRASAGLSAAPQTPASPSRGQSIARPESPAASGRPIVIDDEGDDAGPFTLPPAARPTIAAAPALMFDNLPPGFQASDLHDYLCHLATHSVVEDVVSIERVVGERSVSAKVVFVSWARAGAFFDQHVEDPVAVDGRTLAVSWA